MVALLNRLPVLQRLLGHPTRAEQEMAERCRLLEQRVKRLDASLRFLASTLHCAAGGVMAIHFVSGAKFINPRFTQMWGQTPQAEMAPRSKCKK